MAKAVASLVSSGASMEREAWFAQALQCETDGYPVTCRATVSAAGNVGFDNEDTVTDRCDAWAAEAESFVPAQRTGEAANDNARGIVTARAIFALALDTQPARVDLWRSAADMERAHGGAEDLEQLLKRAVRYCPQAEVLWLMAAKEKWVHQGDVPGARVILEEAFTANPASEAIVLAAVKLESETGQHSRALKLLERARATGFASSNGGEQMAMGTPRVWMKSAVLLRQLDRADEALKLAGNAVELFPEFHKLWLIKAQLEDVPVARQTLSRALKKCSREPVLWTAAAQLELQSQQRNAARARAILERARVYIPREPLLWLEAVRLEAGENMDAARAVMARALQECPRAGMLWAEAILLEPRAQRKAKSVDAMRSTDAHDPFVTVVVARLFWSERRVDKARLWFERAARADPDFGDAWAWWLRFELEQRSLARISSPVADGALPATDGDATAATADGAPPADVHIARIETACAQAAPCHGQYWPQIAKAPANARLATKDVLYKVADFLGSTRQL
ncbi:U4/U6 x U5 tri-snRNP complex subunit Prp1 [Coemansia biformis]|uniref:U4/U6 x U5 tri-snRNP complex subunit Prp1 n=1 Tax=Coemansia biformis TaxID=1286918 RepID=A0A9W7Y955_9FUNG|nr:U4/U6 x U5 tri-snRNP complex subunit Prp1 [Coemansia biformis]